MTDNPTLLLVDDVELFLELERSYLDGEDYQLLTARSGREALLSLEKHRPQLVLLDLYMPEMNGDEVCRLIRANEEFRNLPIIMVTAGGKQEEIDRCLRAGCDDYVTKPVNRHVLVEKVQRLLKATESTNEQIQGFRFRDRGGEWRRDGRLGRMKADALYIHCPSPLDEGTAVELLLQSGEEQTVQVRGKVMRVNRAEDSGMTIYLLQPGEDYFALLPEAERPMPREHKQILQQQDEERERLQREKDLLAQRVAELEDENTEFALQLVKVEEINNNLANLYIASSRLHSTLDREEVLSIIKEVVINFIGAEAFALLSYDQGEGAFRFEMGEGVEEETYPVIAAGHGPIGDIVKTNDSYFNMLANSFDEIDPRQPLAVIPLKIRGELLGGLVIYRLLVQKHSLEDVDYQLFQMLGEHAATALFSATLYGKSERKQKTYREVMDLLLT